MSTSEDELTSDASSEAPTDEAMVAELLAVLGVSRSPVGDGLRFEAEAPDWFGPRVFGGVVAAHALAAACATVGAPWIAHSLHAQFLGAVKPGTVDLEVERVRDGRTFTTREVRTVQDGRTTTRTTVSFCRPEPGPEYQQPMPAVLPPDDLPVIDDGPDPLEMRWIGATDARPDGSHESSRRTWVRARAPLGTDPLAHLALAAFLSDMTGTSFRPHSPGDYGTHVDASIDHAVWFHRPFAADDWLLCDFHTVASASNRSTVRGAFFDEGGRLVMSMAQELLIRRIEDPAAT